MPSSMPNGGKDLAYDGDARTELTTDMLHCEVESSRATFTLLVKPVGSLHWQSMFPNIFVQLVNLCICYDVNF